MYTECVVCAQKGEEMKRFSDTFFILIPSLLNCIKTHLFTLSLSLLFVDTPLQYIYIDTCNTLYIAFLAFDDDASPQILSLILLSFKSLSNRAAPAAASTRKKYYLLALATLSNSSFFLIAYEFELPFAAFTNSSAKHSAIVLTFLNAASLAPVVNK